MMRFDDKTVIVTGGASGIGKATATTFAAQGANVVIADVDEAKAIAVATEIGPQAFGVGVDVSSSEQVQRMVRLVVERFGGIDVLCNNAGFGFRGTVATIEEDDWDRLMSVNLKGVFLCSKYAMPHLIASPTGNIVNTTSYTASAAIADRAAYVASKGAVSALTRAMAVDHAPDRVRVNAVAPGTVDSPYFAEMIRADADPQGLRRSLDERSLLGRMGRAPEIAGAIVWLASEESSFTTGTVFTVDGGSSIWARN